MGDYIDREILKEKFWNACKNCLSENDIADLIDDIPAADVAPVVHSRWERLNRTQEHYCVECGAEFNLYAYCKNMYNYCPYCGAKMDKEDTK